MEVNTIPNLRENVRDRDSTPKVPQWGLKRGHKKWPIYFSSYSGFMGTKMTGMIPELLNKF